MNPSTQRNTRPPQQHGAAPFCGAPAMNLSTVSPWSPGRRVLSYLSLVVLIMTLGCSDRDSSASSELPDLPDLSGIAPASQKEVTVRHQELRSNPTADSWRKYARILHVYGFHQGASEAYLTAAKDTLNSMPDFYLAAMALVSTDRERCLELLRTAEKVNSRYLGIHLYIGRFEAERGQHAAALVAFNKGNRIQLTSAGLNGSARALSALKRKQEALKKLQQALTFERYDSRVYTTMAQVLLSLGRPQESEWAQSLAVDQESNPGFPDALLSSVALEGGGFAAVSERVEGLMKAKRKEEALAACARLIELRPEDSVGQQLKAGVLVMMGRNRQAARICQEILKEKPEDLEVLVTLASAQQKLRMTDESLRNLRKVLAIAPGNPRALYLYGLQMGPIDMPTAIENLSRALELAPLRFPQTRFFLGRLFQRLGKLAEARKMVRDALRFDPADVAAQKLEAELG